ncbi:hypothetical protein O0I10_005564 [Lichtheimia ornata]|uniref:GATA-type domain-containing protein n=1 Tax=Lichtheimia ornata TaxID=688661 RepID=A0AAD7Y1M4_9FUNG|nr:uncharacterized protein O0I10_005564 [Lichtheimia ornata]KAJ8658837.1 hypothetical protein O0I10_005564 [Lichtheimia ornata]
MNTYDDDRHSDPLDDYNVPLHGSMLLSSTDQMVEDYTYIYDPLVVSPSSLSSSSASGSSHPFMPSQQQTLPSPLSSVPSLSWPPYYPSMDVYPHVSNADGEYWPRFSDGVDYDTYTLSSSPEELTTPNHDERPTSYMVPSSSRGTFHLMMPPIGVSSQFHHPTTTTTTTHCAVGGTTTTGGMASNTKAVATTSSCDRKKRGVKRTKEKKKCMNCGATKTPTWRRGPITRWLLCNACGLYEKVSRQRRIVVIQEDGKARISRGMLNKKDEQQQHHRPLLVCASCATTDAKRWHIRGGQKYCERCSREYARRS